MRRGARRARFRGDRATTEFTVALLIAGLDVDDDAQCDAYCSGGLDDSVLEDRDGLALATHLDRTTESVRLLATAARGPGGFPPPAGVAETLPPELIAATNCDRSIWTVSGSSLRVSSRWTAPARSPSA